MDERQISEQLDRIEAAADIRQLVSRYCFAIDDRDRRAIADLFTADARVASEDGIMAAEGLDAVMRQYDQRFAALGPGAHYMHDVVLDLAEAGEGRATGRVSGHAELWRNGRMMVAALRYRDRYLRTLDGWRFAERIIGFLYYVAVEEYPGILGTPLRNRAYAEPLPADFPESLPGWPGYG